ncbi:shikimate kinase [Peribacillus alkalitolerans]|uniref:shikimate kinase n=1 Tax=Peribacillus alkalitolerans TaxID=1550385 RepID=UPI0013CFD257|nr:shikimate kinase [Peribacillus alkalitolerans]
MKTIYLTGFMGSGKTSVGRELARLLQTNVYDTDVLIEQQEKCSITDLFSEKGEDYFRELEGKMLKSLPTQNGIVTTGGGIVLNHSNRQWMNDNGMWVYLHCDPSVIEKRLEKDESRPLIAGEKRNKLRDLFEQRLPIYMEAPIILDTTHLSIEEAAQGIITRINL